MDERKGQESIREKFEEWQEGVGQALSKRPERRPEFKTTSDIPIERIYLPTDTAEMNYMEDLGFPGEHPFTRGVQPTMYRGRHWTMRQYAGFGTAEDTNRRYRYLLEQGQTGLSIAFDLPTQIGYDSDDPNAVGEVGKVGVAIDSIDDMRTLFDGIPLDQVSTSMTINAPAAILLALYVALADEQGVSRDKLNGTVQNDVLKEYTSRGTYIFPPAASMRIATDIFGYCSKEVPNWNTISISGYHMREAGCTAVQEAAFTLANGIAYVEAGVNAGLDVDAFAPRIAFFFCCHLDFLEEVAKFRAARRLWARIMRERFGAKNPRSCMMRFHTQTAGCTLTAQQPMNNVVRVTFQALAAVLGGTQSLHTNSMDEALALPTEEAVQLALRTQQLIAHESGVADTVDPLGGSFCVERLTNEIEERTCDYIRKIDDLGGSPKAIEEGFIQKEIQEAAYRYQQEIESNDRVVVGVNRFQAGEASRISVHRADPTVQEQQIEKLKALRSRRDVGRLKQSLATLKKAAQGGENTMPGIVDAIKADATLGEICDALRDVFGEYEASVVF